MDFNLFRAECLLSHSSKIFARFFWRRCVHSDTFIYYGNIWRPVNFQFLVAIWTAEICKKKPIISRIRGRLGSLMVLSVNIGMIMAYVSGAYIDYHLNCIILLIVPICFFISVTVIHESPIYLMENGKPKVTIINIASN